MAQQGKTLDQSTQRFIRRVAEVLSIRKAAREVGVSPNTIVKYGRKPNLQKNSQ